MSNAGTDGAPAVGTAHLRMQLRWGDLDSLGHLSHSVYHDFLAEVRLAAMSALGTVEPTRFVLAHVELDHRREIRRQDGHVDLRASIVAVGESSITIEHAVLLPDGSVSAEGSSVLVAWDAQARCSRKLSELERRELSAGLEDRTERAGAPRG
jgi:acyl-CoA thioester hydrolase